MLTSLYHTNMSGVVGKHVFDLTYQPVTPDGPYIHFGQFAWTDSVSIVRAYSGLSQATAFILESVMREAIGVDGEIFYIDQRANPSLRYEQYSYSTPSPTHNHLKYMQNRIQAIWPLTVWSGLDSDSDPLGVGNVPVEFDDSTELREEL